MIKMKILLNLSQILIGVYLAVPWKYNIGYMASESIVRMIEPPVSAYLSFMKAAVSILGVVMVIIALFGISGSFRQGGRYQNLP